MTNIVTKPNTNRLAVSSESDFPVYFWSTVFTVLLFLRDSYSVGINKYLFIVITVLCAITMKPKQLIYLFSFLFPLYVGLPGNYMTLIFLLRLSLDYKNILFRRSSVFFTVAISLFIFLQNYITGYTSITHMMFIPGVVLVLFLFSYRINLDYKMMILLYSFGVASLGMIMLISTLQVYELSSLMSVAFRLGSASVNYVSSNVMNVNVDPNYYGLFAIAAISAGIPLIRGTTISRIEKTLLLVALISIVTVCLLGLSRAFVMVLVIWMILYLFLQKSAKNFILVAFAITLGIILVFRYMPDVANILLARFVDSDMATGNGRILIIQHFFDLWSESIFYMIFGIGLFNNNVHSMPLQYLFGGGIMLCVLMVGFVISLRTNQAFNKKSILERWLPMIVTLMMASTVPVAGLLNFMFPIIIAGFNLRISNLELER